MSKQVQGVVGYRSKVDAKGRPLQSWPSQHADRLDNPSGRDFADDGRVPCCLLLLGHSLNLLSVCLSLKNSIR